MISQKQLIELGFSSKEAGVYLSLLELGPATATQIARKAKINRTTSYDILNSLLNEGLVSLVGETRVQRFAAENPKKVINFLDNRINKAKEKLAQAGQLMPELLSIYNVAEKPRVKYYEGIEGMLQAFEDTLTATGEICAYAVGEDMFKALGREYFKKYFAKRVANKISVRAIAPDDLASRQVAANDAQEMRITLLVPRDKFHFTVEVNIYNNKIMMASWQEKFAIIVESAELAGAQKKIFELSWLGAKRV